MPRSSRAKSAEVELARAQARVAVAGRCPRLIHILIGRARPDVTPGCPGCEKLLADWAELPPEQAPAPTPQQLAAAVERVDVTSPAWPEVRDALARALGGDALADPATRRELGEMLRRLPTTNDR
jgi:hypothetical protein